MGSASACENAGVIVQSLRRAQGAIVGGNFSDPTNERLIYLSALGLAVLGALLLVGTIMWWRRGRQEHPALSPLEVMGGRAWHKATEGDRRRRLDQVRIAGAGAAVHDPAHSEPVDLEALVRSVPQAFDDLREPGEAVEEVGNADVWESDQSGEADLDPPPASDEREEDATSVEIERPLEELGDVSDNPKSTTVDVGVGARQTMPAAATPESLL